MSTRSSLATEDTLKEFYGLKTLQPSDYQRDTVPSSIPMDLSGNIPKEVIYKLLADDSPDDDKSSAIANTQRKTQDPLGFDDSILDELIDKDVIDDSRDPKSAKYMIDSKSFNPSLFLSTLHGDKSAKQLLESIQYLESDLQSKKPLLQQLIASNFTRTLQTKNSLDKVFSQFTQSSMTEDLGALQKSLANSSGASNQLLNPILLHISKEREIKQALQAVRDNKELLDLPPKLQRLIEQRDFYSIVNEYKRGRQLYQAAKSKEPENPLIDRVWSKVGSIVDNYKQALWETLGTIHIEDIKLNFDMSKHDDESFLTLISRITELGSDEDPVVEFVNLQNDYISKDIDEGLGKVHYAQFLKSRENLSTVYSAASDSLQNSALKYVYMKLGDSKFSSGDIDSDIASYDLPLVIEQWDFLTSYIGEITDDILAKKVLHFAKIVQYFSVRQNGSINEYDLQKMRSYVESLVAKVCSRLLFIFGATGSDLVKSPQGQGETSRSRDLSSTDSFGFIPPHANAVSSLYAANSLQRKVIDSFNGVKSQSSLLDSVTIDSAIEKTLKMINLNLITGVLATLNSDIGNLEFIENWAPSTSFEGCTRLPEFLENYYREVVQRIGELVVVPDKALMQRIQDEFLRSFQLLAEKQLDMVLKKSQECPDKKDFYFITSISNLSTLKLRVMPRIISTFDKTFGTSLSTAGDGDGPLKVYSSLEEYELILYREYLKGYRSQLKSILGNGIRSTNWYQMEIDRSQVSQINVSPFILQSINFINTIKSRLLNMGANKNYILKVELDLDNYLISKLVDFLKEIRQFNTDGLLQICIDLQFLCEIFRSLKESNQRNLRNEIDLDKLENVASKFLKKKGDDQELIDASVTQNLIHNKAQMECFFGL